MKTQKVVRVNFLRIYPELQDAGAGKKPKAGALILMEPVAGSVAHELTSGQLDNLASIAGINTTGKRAWRQLASLVSVGRSACTVTTEPVKKGDKYVDTDGVEKEYTKDWEKSSIDSIMLPNDTVAKLQDAVIADVIKGWEDLPLPVFEGNAVPDPALAGTVQ